MRTVRSAKGEMVDMAALFNANQDQPALGMGGMNARGDLIDRHGNVVKPREDIALEYHTKSPRAVRHVPLSSLSADIPLPTPAEAVAAIVEANGGAASKPAKKSRIGETE